MNVLLNSYLRRTTVYCIREVRKKSKIAIKKNGDKDGTLPMNRLQKMLFWRCPFDPLV